MTAEQILINLIIFLIMYCYFRNVDDYLLFLFSAKYSFPW